jgi:hypothetical protein
MVKSCVEVYAPQRQFWLYGVEASHAAFAGVKGNILLVPGSF